MRALPRLQAAAGPDCDVQPVAREVAVSDAVLPVEAVDVER